MPLLILTLLAALSGALGVGLSAMASHAYAGTSLSVAASMLLIHAPALLAAAAAIKAGVLNSKVGLAGAFVLAAGLALFSGDLVVRTLYGVALLPMAAPIGGMGLIGGWLVLGVAGLMAPRD